MDELKHLFANNQIWAQRIKEEQPDFFTRLSKLQSPEYLWIGCADSRVPANEIVNLLPGELFVHRNVANIVLPTDLNCLSVIQYAIDILKIKHIIICGHYGCGGVKAAMEHQELGLIDNWICSIKDTYQTHHEEMSAINDASERLDRLCELNVIEQVTSACHTNIVQRAWKRGQALTVHGWIYGIENGILENLEVSCSSMEQLPEIYRFLNK